MSLDLDSIYLVAAEDLSKEEIAALRAKLAAKTAINDVDASPNTPFGDLMVSPGGVNLATHQEIWRRFFSDMDLENTSNGITYNCFRRSTEFVTRSGVASFEDFEDGDVIEVLSHSGNWRKATVRSGGVQALNRIEILRGKLKYDVFATPGHRWLLRNGGDTTNLKVGDKLLEAPCVYGPWDYEDASVEERLAWAYGYVFGDGTRQKDKTGEYRYSLVRLCGRDKAKYLDRFLSLGFKNSAPNSFNGDAVVYTGEYLKQPIDLNKDSIEVVQAFVRGFLDADGVRNYNTPTSRKDSSLKEFTAIQTSGADYIEFVRKTFPAVGQYIAYEHDETGRNTNLGCRKETVRFGLNNWIFDHAPKFVVDKISPAGEEEVWCLEVEEDRSFVLPFGLATGNCDFVRSYLEQFGLYDSSRPRKSFGLMRLTFDDNTAREIDQSTIFSTSGREFRPSLPYEGSLSILAPADPAPTEGNFARLVAQGQTSWVVDITIEGDAGDSLDAGTSFDVDRDIDGLVSAVLLDGFQSGEIPTRLIELARRARFNTHSTSPSTRGGVINGVNQILPGLRALGCVVSGDQELARDSINQGGASAGCMDVLVRGDLLATDTAVVRLNYIDTGSGYKFFGELLLPQKPILIESLISEEQILIAEPDYISVSNEPTGFPALAAAYGKHERIFVEFDMPMSDDVPLINTLVDDSGEEPIEYAYFTIQYRFDPSCPLVDTLLQGDNAPVGIRHYVRYFTPVVVQTLNVLYNRSAGTKINLAAPRAELLEALNRHTYYSPSGPANVVDSMKYAGAHSVEDIELVGKVRFSCADWVFTGTTAPTEILDAAAYVPFKAQVSAVAHAAVLDFFSPDFVQSAGVGLFGVSGPRSVTWVADTENLTFTENRTIG